MGDHGDEITTTTVTIASDEPPLLCALVSIDGVVTTHVLPRRGEVEIGRAST